MALGKNDTQFDKFKTPFYVIRVGNSDGKNMVPLPPTLSKLIERVEIIENLEGCFHNYQISIIMKEGSREPFRQNSSVSSNSLYSDVDVSNATGMLTDLQFSKLGKTTGFTSVLPAAVGKVLQIGAQAASALSGFLGGGAVPEQEDNVNDVKFPTSVNYVFEERNLIEITWGYRENQTETRTVSGYIQVVRSSFPENGHPSITINALSPGAAFDQVTPKTGITFSTQNIAGVDLTAGPIYSFQDMSTKDVITDICSKAGMKCIVSDNLLNTTADKYHVKTWPAGKSFNQFMKDMARETNAFYVTFVDPKTQQTTIAFISKQDWMSKTIIPNKGLLTYRGQESILKSVDVVADFSHITGNQQVGIDSTGKVVRSIVNSGDVGTVMFEGANQVDANPTSHNPITAAKQLNANVAKNGDQLVGKTEINPEADDPVSIKETAVAKSNCMIKGMVTLEFATLGYTRLRPGMVSFLGIGKRYSGEYNIISVTHTLDSNGYMCKGAATSEAVYGQSGIKVPKAASGQPATTTSTLFESKLSYIPNPSSIGLPGISSSSFGLGSAMDDYNKAILS